MVAEKTNVRVPRSRRNHHKPWTPEAIASFTRDWGRLSARKLVDKYGRTENALYKYATKVLRLPPQSKGYVSIASASRTLGMSGFALLTLAGQCGITPVIGAPLSDRKSGFRRRVVDAVEMEIVTRKRDIETTATQTYCVKIGRGSDFIDRRLKSGGLLASDGSRKWNRIPVGLAEEVAAGTEGPWCTVWRAVLAAGELPVARWFVALAVHDYVFGDVPSREWFETVATKTSRDVVMPLVKQLRGPSVVRAERKSDVSRRRNRERAA
jgi:hypothetical protein